MKTADVESRAIRLAVSGKSNVLITGPTGAGKTFLARQIHERSHRRDKPFVTVNLATLHDGTLESELFGHEKGSFTSADSKRVGRLQLAQGGTVFLDEIGDLPPRLQARLLEFLQSRVVTPVGGNREIPLDIRVIAATNKDLSHAVARGEFREDLFHRLRVISIELKPLSDRWDEFDRIVHACLAEICAASGKSVLQISESVAEIFEKYRWPGNLRELRNVLEYAVLSSERGTIGIEDLPAWFLDEVRAAETDLASPELTVELASYFLGMSYQVATAQFEKQYLRHALVRHRGRISQTARKIGINKTTLIRRIRRYDLLSNGFPS